MKKKDRSVHSEAVIDQFIGVYTPVENPLHGQNKRNNKTE
jgi:hypothetical protein